MITIIFTLPFLYEFSNDFWACGVSCLIGNQYWIERFPQTPGICLHLWILCKRSLNVKGVLSNLRQFLATESPLKWSKMFFTLF